MQSSAVNNLIHTNMIWILLLNELNQLNHILEFGFQGPAATNVPERIYGVIDLYGQAAQATQYLYYLSFVFVKKINKTPFLC